MKKSQSYSVCKRQSSSFFVQSCNDSGEFLKMFHVKQLQYPMGDRNNQEKDKLAFCKDTVVRSYRFVLVQKDCCIVIEDFVQISNC